MNTSALSVKLTAHQGKQEFLTPESADYQCTEEFPTIESDEYLCSLFECDSHEGLTILVGIPGTGMCRIPLITVCNAVLMKACRGYQEFSPLQSIEYQCYQCKILHLSSLRRLLGITDPGVSGMAVLCV
ncbi:hypothetical protein T01_3878 [Trichinella spiralis]|uniref:Uncharacterized protein n=1 Tax=Trichinella spiralis TaxID=6334 RepID=A0A0V1BHH7_TRISP|nr:hypothetical protein T01_3878 [Trichinella spiralis]